jgi:WD40 repeat protein
MLRSQQDAISGAAYSPDGRHLITGSGNATIRIWTTGNTSQPLVLEGFRASTTAVSALAGDRYATAHDGGTIRVWTCLQLSES